MELPDDILKHIRKYTRPLFVHRNIFNLAKRYVEPHDLEDLRQALMTPDAVQVHKELENYITIRQQLDSEPLMLTQSLDRLTMQITISIKLVSNQKVSFSYRELMFYKHGYDIFYTYDWDTDDWDNKDTIFWVGHHCAT
jgi:hypothetical protein